MKKILPIANGLALVLTIAINYIASSGLMNGNTMKTISDRYFNYFTPAGYAFSIWGVIYLGLLGFVVYTGSNLIKSDQKAAILSNVGWWFVLSCAANSLWVVAWLNDYIGLSVILMGVIFFSLFQIILKLRMELDAHPLKHYLLIYWPFAIYFGWITVAAIANIAAYLTKLQWDGWGIAAESWAIIMIAIAGLVNVFVIYSRNLREFAVVGIWALFAISVSNKAHSANVSIIYTCYIVIAVIAIAIIANGLKSKTRSIESM